MRQLPEDRNSNVAPAAARMCDFAAASTGPDATLEPGAVIATVLHARLHGFSAACQAMGPEDAAAFVTEVRRMLTDVVTRLGGEVAQRRPDSILAVFSNKPEEKKPNHAQRGLHAAILAVHEAVQLAQALASRSQLADLPALTLAVGVHLGPAEVKLRSKANGMVHAVGEAVEVARRLELAATELHWSVATSAGTRLAAAGRAEGGGVASVSLPDNSFIDVVEVTGLVPRKGSNTPPRVFEMLRESIQANQQVRRRSPGGAQQLPPEHRQLQAVLEGLMARDRERHPSGRMRLEDLARIGL